MKNPFKKSVDLETLKKEVSELKIAVFGSEWRGIMGMFAASLTPNNHKESRFDFLNKEVEEINKKLNVLMGYLKIEFQLWRDHPEYEIIPERPKPKDSDIDSDE